MIQCAIWLDALMRTTIDHDTVAVSRAGEEVRSVRSSLLIAFQQSQNGCADNPTT